MGVPMSCAVPGSPVSIAARAAPKATRSSINSCGIRSPPSVASESMQRHGHERRPTQVALVARPQKSLALSAVRLDQGGDGLRIDPRHASRPDQCRVRFGDPFAGHLACRGRSARPGHARSAPARQGSRASRQESRRWRHQGRRRRRRLAWRRRPRRSQPRDARRFARPRPRRRPRDAKRGSRQQLSCPGC